MSPRAACRLETLGLRSVHDYVGGKAEWLANGLPREGKSASVLYAGEAVDEDPPTCALHDTVADVRAALDGSRYGFCLVLSEHRVLLGRVRRSAMEDADPKTSAESVMEPGPSTGRFNTPARDLVKTLASKDLKTAIVTTPSGCLVGVFHRGDVEQRLAQPAAP
jgi:CBS-domain-containing membrane protein